MIDVDHAVTYGKNTSLGVGAGVCVGEGEGVDGQSIKQWCPVVIEFVVSFLSLSLKEKFVHSI